VRMHQRIAPLAGRSQAFKNLFPVARALEHRLAVVAAGSYMDMISATLSQRTRL
jgi:hypothetical protein